MDHLRWPLVRRRGKGADLAGGGNVVKFEVHRNVISGILRSSRLLLCLNIF